jgi:alpha-galactosidase
MHHFYDPAFGHPWEKGTLPEFVYTADLVKTHRPWISNNFDSNEEYFTMMEQSPDSSGEFAVPIMEGLHFGIEKHIPAVNITNNGTIPNLPQDMVVEIPVNIIQKQILPVQMKELPEPIAALCRTQGSINKLLTESFIEKSKQKLIQALLLEPVVNSYRQCIQMTDEMISLQKTLLPPLL